MRNLTAAEIVGQILVARDDLGDWGRKPDEKRLVSNLVLMGMGEPLYNFDAVRDAMQIAMDGEGIALSRRRITLSTSGVVPEIARVGEEIGCLLAISFHATTDAVRDTLVPINRKWTIAALLDACRAYPRLSNAERITFEYVMLKGVNDSDADARRLVQADRRHPGEDQPDPVQPLARRALRALGARRGSRPSARSSTAPATPRRSARRAARTSWPPAASSRAPPSGRGGSARGRARGRPRPQRTAPPRSRDRESLPAARD